MRLKMAGKKPEKESIHPCCWIIESAPPAQLYEAGRKTVTHEDSWKEQSDVLQCHVVIRHHRHFSSTGKTHKEPEREMAEQRRGGWADIQGQQIEASIHALSQFRVLGGWLCSLSLLLTVSFSLSSSPDSSMCPRQSRKSADVCTNTMTLGYVCSRTSKERQNSKERIMERGRTGWFVWRVVKSTRGSMLCLWWYIPRWMAFFQGSSECLSSKMHPCQHVFPYIEGQKSPHGWGLRIL